MSDCVICLSDGAEIFDGLYRPASCICTYKIHADCYKQWLITAGGAFNCVICHAVVQPDEVPCHYGVLLASCFLGYLILTYYYDVVIVFALITLGHSYLKVLRERQLR